MKPNDFLIALLDASGGSIRGRTLLQKRAFFVSILCGKEKELGFTAHYYGPFSPSIDVTLAQLKSLGFVDEVAVGFGAVNSEGFEVKRYDYRLTEDGKKIAASLKKKYPQEYEQIVENLRKLERAGNPNYLELSFAAKAFFVLRSKKRPMTRRELNRNAERFDWKIPEQSLQKAVSFLENIGLVATR